MHNVVKLHTVITFITSELSHDVSKYLLSHKVNFFTLFLN